MRGRLSPPRERRRRTMIKWVRVYENGRNPEKHYDVMHEESGRLFGYCESGGVPKTVRDFIKGKTPIPYKDKYFDEHGVIYYRGI